MSKRGTPRPKPDTELTFEEALEQVESIIERIESGQIGLERSIDEYERGVAMIRRCREVLARAEQRVQDLTAQMMGDTGARPAASPTPGAPEQGNGRAAEPEPPF